MAVPDAFRGTGGAGGENDGCRIVGLRSIPRIVVVDMRQKRAECNDARHGGRFHADDEAQIPARLVAELFEHGWIAEHHACEMAAPGDILRVCIECVRSRPTATPPAAITPSWT